MISLFKILQEIEIKPQVKLIVGREYDLIGNNRWLGPYTYLGINNKNNFNIKTRHYFKNDNIGRVSIEVEYVQRDLENGRIRYHQKDAIN